MQLFAYSQLGQPGELVIWVGVRGVSTVPDPVFFLNDSVVAATVLRSFRPLGDGVRDSAGKPINYSGVFVLAAPASSERLRIEVLLGDTRTRLSTKALPDQLPAKQQPGFNLLLSSCYYQPNDRAQPLATVLAQLKPQPDLTLLAGDQVYLDLPSLQNLPTEPDRLAQVLGQKYADNWFAGVSQPGLAPVLAHGPVLCVPDDHEYWNNFPLKQAQLNNTHSDSDRQNWQQVATDLYQSYQMAPAQAAGFYRRDIAPLCMLFLDGRTHRDASGKQMFNGATHRAILQWQQDLLTLHEEGRPAVGLLSSGQALLIEKPGWWDRNVADMEMPNYQDFALLQTTLKTLFSAGIPVLYITGDVHWGRIVEGRNLRGQTLFYEVIASPSRLIDTLGSDQKNELLHWLGRWIGRDDDFPRHPSLPEQLPAFKLDGLQLQLSQLHAQRGDHVAMLRFHALPGGLEFSVDYHCTDPDPEKRRKHSLSLGPFKLTSL